MKSGLLIITQFDANAVLPLVKMLAIWNYGNVDDNNRWAVKAYIYIYDLNSTKYIHNIKLPHYCIGDKSASKRP